jgi:NAD(P)-dependent dehydrogenase (short-subunit alcohol dehydrogenase family)
VRADVGVPADVDRLFQTTLDQFGRIDILVNNAGTSQPQDIFQITAEDWEKMIRTNLTSCFLCSQAAMRQMAKQRSGRIVNISSVVGHQGALFGHVHYAATKSGMLGITKTLARTAAPLGITVNAVAPGCIETDLLHQTLGPQRVAEMAAKIPLGLGTPRDVGLAVAFLCGEGGRYITGATIDVNGGLYLR